MGTGVKNAALEGVHLKLPGHGNNGPTLEIYTYHKVLENLTPVANRKGLGHLAFEVNDVEKVLAKLIKNGGKAIGAISQNKVDQVGLITFVYTQDPDGNIIELQNWKKET